MITNLLTMSQVDKLEEIRYPIGRLTIDPDITESKRRLWIAQIAELPAKLRAAVDGLSDKQLNQPYRPEGWTVRQVVHHLADEHINGFTYFKMAITEDEPVVKTYDEPRWAETEDACEASIELSLNILTALHGRWVILLNSLDEKGFARGYTLDPTRKLFLAIRDDVYASIFEQPEGEFSSEDVNISILVFNADREEVVQWISPR
jgi:DinB superfamily/XisH protein